MKKFFLLLVIITTNAQEKKFENYNQKIAGNDYRLEMIAIPSGIFNMGSPNYEKNRLADEGPVHKVKVDSFWMGKFEITWDIFELFMLREIDSKKIVYGNEVKKDVDGISGATTPYVDMTFGMGLEGYPAISMTQLSCLLYTSPSPRD